MIAWNNTSGIVLQHDWRKLAILDPVTREHIRYQGYLQPYIMSSLHHIEGI